MATVRAAWSGPPARVIGTQAAGPAAPAVAWVPAPPASAAAGSTAVTAWTGLTMPWPVPRPAAPSAVAVIRATT